MKLKASLIALSLFIFLFAAHSQNFKYDVSESFKMGSYFRNAVKSGDNWLSMRWTYEPGKWYQDKKVAFLMLMNDRMEVIKEVQIPLENNKFMDIKGLYKINGVTVFLYSYKLAKSDEEFTIAGKKINEADLSAGTEINLGHFASTKGNTVPYFDFKYTPDSAKYFLFTEAIQNDKDPKVFYFKVLNNDLSKVHEKHIQLEDQNRFVRLYETYLDKEDNVYVQYRVYEKEAPETILLDEEAGKMPAYKTLMTVYRKNGSSKDISLNLNGRFLHAAMFQATKNNRLIIGGTYQSTPKKGNVTGVFYGNYDAGTNEITDLQMKDFPGDILELFATDKVASVKGDVGISPNFKPIRFSERNNGSLDLSLESNYGARARSESASGNFQSIYYNWWSEGILNVNITSKDKIVFTRIPKKQTDVGTRSYLSNSSFYVGNKLMFFYNDDKSNLDRDINKKPDNIEKFRNSVLVAAVIDEKGNLERKLVNDNSVDDYVPIATDIKKIAPNSYLVKSYKTGKVFDTEKSRIGVITVIK